LINLIIVENKVSKETNIVVTMWQCDRWLMWQYPNTSPRIWYGI